MQDLPQHYRVLVDVQRHFFDKDGLVAQHSGTDLAATVLVGS